MRDIQPSTSSVFLRAEWRYLAMLNYSVAADVIQPLVPPGTELDDFNGAHIVSVVGFLFLNTRVCGVAIPFHRDFEEVNLRFYVRRRVGDQWRRGVVFVREIVPRLAIATVARVIYGEPYIGLPMRHTIRRDENALEVGYEWRRGGAWEGLSANAIGAPRLVSPGTEEEFITEHYWGYTRRRQDCSEYEVEHPRWRVWTASDCTLRADIETLYGRAFVPSLSGPPASAFIAEGSPIAVRRHRFLC